MSLKVKSAVFVLFLLFSFGTTSVYSQDMFESGVEYNDWLMTYYINPDKDKLIDSMIYFTKSKMYEDVNGRSLLVSFYAAGFSEHEQLMDEVFSRADVDGTENTRIFLYNVYWQINNKKSKEFMQKVEESWGGPGIVKAASLAKERKPFNVLKDPITHALHIDMLWAYYFATGNKKYVERVIKSISLAEGDNFETMMIGGAAQWSLKSNAKLDKRIKQICLEQIKKHRGYVREQLRKIIEER